MTNESLYDETQWSFEPGDPSVGIFGESWVHEGCAKEYDQGCTHESSYSGRFVERGMVYANETVTVTCLDCGATMSVTDKSFMGFEGEQGI